MMLHAPLFWLLFLGHLLGDYYLQSEQMAQGKQRHVGWLLLHCLVYAIAMGITLSPVLLTEGWPWHMSLLLFGIPAVSHAVIDCVKALFTRRPVKDIPRFDRKVFLIDQLLHLAVIIGVTAWHGTVVGQLDINPWGALLLDGYGMLGLQEMAGPFQALRILCLLLVIGKPANVAIRKVIAKRPAKPVPPPPKQAAPAPKKTTLLSGRPLDVLIQIMEPPQQQEADADQAAEPQGPAEAAESAAEEARTGRWIGVLERVLVVALMMLGEYGAVGLVFTAKSLTRFDRIVKDKGFAEYYLIGTLASILFAMAALFLAQPMR